MTWRIEITPTALAMLREISDRRVRGKLTSVIDRLAEDPEKQGKALVGELTGYRSIRAVGQRYRVIYRLIDDRIVVCVVAIGIRHDGSRKDVYALARKLFRLRLLDEGE